MALTSKITVALEGLLSKSLDLGNVNAPVNLNKVVSYGDGTADGQADLIFHDQRTLSASSNEDIDLAGILTDAMGDTITMAEVKAIVVVAASSNPALLTVKGASATHANPFDTADAGVLVPPGGFFAWNGGTGGLSVTAGTADLINIASGAGDDHIYDIYLIGAGA